MIVILSLLPTISNFCHPKLIIEMLFRERRGHCKKLLPVGAPVTVDARKVYIKKVTEVAYQAFVVLAGFYPATPFPTLLWRHVRRRHWKAHQINGDRSQRTVGDQRRHQEGNSQSPEYLHHQHSLCLRHYPAWAGGFQVGTGGGAHQPSLCQDKTE